MSRHVTTAGTAAAMVLCVAATLAQSPAQGPPQGAGQAPPPGQSRPDPLVREGVTEKVTDHVYVIPDASVSLVPNIGIIVGSRGTMVIDTGMGVRNGQAVMREMAKVSKNAEVYLATTHVHPEHDLGAMAFPPSTRMLRSRDQEREIADTGLEVAQRFSGMSAINAELLKGAEFRKATMTFETEQVIDLGGVKVRAMAMGTNHTRGDTGFYVEPDGVLFTGDVVMQALPAFSSPGSSVSHWLESLDRFSRLQPKRIVPSHGPMGDASFIDGYRTFLSLVSTRAAALKKEGKSLDETLATLQTELQNRYDRQRMASAVRAAYSEAP